MRLTVTVPAPVAAELVGPGVALVHLPLADVARATGAACAKGNAGDQPPKPVVGPRLHGDLLVQYAFSKCRSGLGPPGLTDFRRVNGVNADLDGLATPVWLNPERIAIGHVGDRALPRDGSVFLSTCPCRT